MSLSAADGQDEEKALLSTSGPRENWGSLSAPARDTAHQSSETNDRYYANILLASLLFMSVTSAVVGVVLLARAKSNQMLVDCASSICDVAAYFASILANFYVQGKPREKKDRVEFWTAVFSTILLYCVGLKIGFECSQQMRCALDTHNHVDGTVRCSFWLERPDPKAVIFLEFFKLCIYVAFSFLFLRGPYIVGIRKNVNLMSALLHMCVDLMQGVVFGLASFAILYTKKTENQVKVDATASIFALLALLISTVHVWKDFCCQK